MWALINCWGTPRNLLDMWVVDCPTCHVRDPNNLPPVIQPRHANSTIFRHVLDHWFSECATRIWVGKGLAIYSYGMICLPTNPETSRQLAVLVSHDPPIYVLVLVNHHGIIDPTVNKPTNPTSERESVWLMISHSVPFFWGTIFVDTNYIKLVLYIYINYMPKHVVCERISQWFIQIFPSFGFRISCVTPGRWLSTWSPATSAWSARNSCGSSGDSSGACRGGKRQKKSLWCATVPRSQPELRMGGLEENGALFGDVETGFVKNRETLKRFFRDVKLC